MFNKKKGLAFAVCRKSSCVIAFNDASAEIEQFFVKCSIVRRAGFVRLKQIKWLE
jgi:hypothetical protein